MSERLFTGIAAQFAAAYLHGKQSTTETGTEHNLYCSPRLAGQDVEITSKSDPWEYVGEEDVNGACDYLLIEYGPVRGVPCPQVVQVPFQQPKWP